MGDVNQKLFSDNKTNLQQGPIASPLNSDMAPILDLLFNLFLLIANILPFEYFNRFNSLA